MSYVSADIPRGNGNIIGPDETPVQDYWFGVILACRREFGDEAKEVVREWSKSSDRYVEEGFEQAWAQYKPEHPNPVTIRSVFRLAKALGWPGYERVPSEQTVPKSGYRLLDRKAILALPPLKWRVKGLLPETGVGAIFGPSGSGKSFLAFDLGVAITRGKKWFGRRTTPCSVTYIILEGEAGLRNRFLAWEKHNKARAPDDFHAITQPFNLAEPEQVEALGNALPSSSMVIIDTLNRAAPGLDENSSVDMGRMLAGMKRLQEITGGLVLVVHHTGKDASKGLRGHSSLHAALDGAIEVERSHNGRAWSAAKVKDGEDGKQMPFRLQVVELGIDGDGERITSCAVGPDAGALFKPRPPKGANQRAALDALQRLFAASTSLGKAGAAPTDRCLTWDDAIEAAANAMVGQDKKRRGPRAREAVQGLVAGGHLRRGLDEEGQEWLWR